VTEWKKGDRVASAGTAATASSATPVAGPLHQMRAGTDHRHQLRRRYAEYVIVPHEAAARILRESGRRRSRAAALRRHHDLQRPPQIAARARATPWRSRASAASAISHPVRRAHGLPDHRHNRAARTRGSSLRSSARRVRRYAEGYCGRRPAKAWGGRPRPGDGAQQRGHREHHRRPEASGKLLIVAAAVEPLKVSGLTLLSGKSVAGWPSAARSIPRRPSPSASSMASAARRGLQARAGGAGLRQDDGKPRPVPRVLTP